MVRAVAGAVSILLPDSDILDAIVGSAVSQSLCVLGEADISAVVQGTATLASRHDLETGQLALCDLLGQRELVDTQRAGAGGVPELRGQGDIEVGRIVAKTEIDEDVAPFMMQVQLDGTAVKGPICNISVTVVDSSA